MGDRQAIQMNQYQTGSMYDIVHDMWITAIDFYDFSKEKKGGYTSDFRVLINIPQGSTKEQVVEILKEAIIKLSND